MLLKLRKESDYINHILLYYSKNMIIYLLLSDLQMLVLAFYQLVPACLGSAGVRLSSAGSCLRSAGLCIGFSLALAGLYL